MSNFIVIEDDSGSIIVVFSAKFTAPEPVLFIIKEKDSFAANDPVNNIGKFWAPLLLLV